VDEVVAGAVELRGVDVVDARGDGVAQQGERRVPSHRAVLQLHRPEADAGDGATGQLGEAAGSGRIRHSYSNRHR
jgi:hypothetical protein